MKISIVVAVAQNNVIGFKGKIPWRMPKDLAHLKELTIGKVVVLGMNTYVSMESYYNTSGREMPGKLYIILSDQKGFNAKRNNAVVAKSFYEAFDIAKKAEAVELFIIGGASVYKQAIEFADKIYLTKIKSKFEGDTFFPEIDKINWEMVSCEKHSKDDKNPYDYEFCEYEKTKS